ncbi:uncharacterized protein MELLADRAFT_103596 [Melampsora larici-populina 98AG31]|uniref:Uncharacterized protein n=1 Tax=Melampsora larici-populina (strain 98AG31 / pathotype 3-4-7) TaxID=747676 RepID=F4RBV1_MELLP|nr:uncharacterized protein MELLADRAFT_103596 [Melampsora larici-populina 98AG31]EGG10277.1 hypothetical protein MELLADRAFT_103596 [Melampsora larici-populina 98AG31]
MNNSRLFLLGKTLYLSYIPFFCLAFHDLGTKVSGGKATRGRFYDPFGSPSLFPQSSPKRDGVGSAQAPGFSFEYSPPTDLTQDARFDEISPRRKDYDTEESWLERRPSGEEFQAQLTALVSEKKKQTLKNGKQDTKASLIIKAKNVNLPSKTDEQKHVQRVESPISRIRPYASQSGNRICEISEVCQMKNKPTVQYGSAESIKPPESVGSAKVLDSAGEQAGQTGVQMSYTEATKNGHGGETALEFLPTTVDLSNQTKMHSNPYKTSDTHSKSFKRWARTVRANDKLGMVSKQETKVVQSLVRRHMRLLLCRETKFSPIPPSLSAAEQEGLIERFPENTLLPHGAAELMIMTTDFVKTGCHMKKEDQDEIEKDLKRWGLRRFSMNWGSDMNDRCNILGREFFWVSFYRSIKNRVYKFRINPDLLRRQIILPAFDAEFKQLSSMYRDQCSSAEILGYHAMVHDKQMACKEYADFLGRSGVSQEIVAIFQPRNFHIMGNQLEVTVVEGDKSFIEVHVAIPRWWSDKAKALIELIESRVHSHVTSQNDFPALSRWQRKYFITCSTDYGVIPRHLPADLYSTEFKDSLLPTELEDLKMKPDLLPPAKHMAEIFPADLDEAVFHPFGAPFNQYYPSDDELSSDELIDSESEDELQPSPEIKRIEEDFKIQVEALKEDIQTSKSTFARFQTEINTSIPLRLEELNNAKIEIADLNKKIIEIQAQLNSGSSDSGSQEQDVIVGGDLVGESGGGSVDV